MAVASIDRRTVRTAELNPSERSALYIGYLQIKLYKSKADGGRFYLRRYQLQDSSTLYTLIDPLFKSSNL